MQILTRITTPPDPLPWIARPLRNIGISVDTAQRREPIKKTATVVSSIALRPQISLSFPHTGLEVAFAKR